jgi:hypothetical protein
MTFGIAASGPRAGAAVLAALAAVERTGTGSIGGFCSFAALDSDGNVVRAETQRGGSATLFLEGETTGAPPPAHIDAAPRAALISSGPDRPAPLSQFLAAGPAGLVTGHRLPNGYGADGRRYNEAVLAALARGSSPADAVRQVLEADPNGDVGLIALDRAGALHAENSVRVKQRSDLAQAERSLACGARVAVLLNAIRPPQALATLAAEIALEVLGAAPRVLGAVSARAGVSVVAADEDLVEVDAHGRVWRVLTRDLRLASGRHNAAAIYLGARVVQAGRTLGHILSEPNCLVADGAITAFNGATEVRLVYGVAVGDPSL